MSRTVWIVWEYDPADDCPYIGSLHDTEAGARAEAQRLAEAAYAREKAAHDAREQRRVAESGAWRYPTPETLAPDWVPTKPRPEPAPFEPTAGYEHRVESYEVAE